MIRRKTNMLTRAAKCLAGLQDKSPFNHLSISAPLILLVLALALPLNLVIGGVIWDLIHRANEAQRTSLVYAARSIAAGVDAELGTYVALAQALARSPALLDTNVEAFEVEARRAVPTGADAWVMVSNADGQQLMNTFAEPGQALPRRNPVAIAAQRRAFATRSVVISDLFRSPLTKNWIATIDVPISRMANRFVCSPSLCDSANFCASSVPRTPLRTGLPASSMAKTGSSLAFQPSRSANSPPKGGARSKIKLMYSNMHPLKAI